MFARAAKAKSLDRAGAEMIAQTVVAAVFERDRSGWK
jgi:hypothetical protein